MKTQNKALQFLIRLVKSLIIPVGMWAIFALLTNGRTASTRMLITTLRQCVSASVICYGLILAMNVGMINFSAGAMMLFAGIVGGNLAKTFGLGWPGLLIICILFCLAEGALEGLLYNAMRVPCIVMSIGMMLVWESFPKVIYPNGVNLSGAGMGSIIGRRGETLDAIQHLTGYVINKGQNKRIHVSVDAEEYRAKREESLRSLAYKVAAKVVKYRKNMTLEPMNSYERHVIHTALQEYEEVSTYSTGSEPNRRVVVAYGRSHRSERKPGSRPAQE